MSSDTENCLYYGDNLDILRDHIPDESVDLVYLDPPFNSARDYNVLFASPKGERSEAQIVAFKDSWEWGEQAEREYEEIVRGDNTDVAEMVQALRRFLRENDMMAYLVMMARRLLELRRVLKPTGSLYLHCDPVASHYLKIVLDSVFGKENFHSEIIWKRTSSHNSARRWGPIHDTIFFYSRSSAFTWNKVHGDYEESYTGKYYRHKDADGRSYRLSDLTGSGTRNGESGKAWGGFDPTAAGRHWAIPTDVKKQFDMPTELTTHQWLDLFNEQALISMFDEGRSWPHVKRYLDRMPGVAAQDIILDISPLSSRDAERLGYPTQKPLALLERIIQASSDEGDVVLDPFCGCGTAVHAAQKLGRKWIGIDITHLAVALIEKRLKGAFPGTGFDVHGTPKDISGARDLAARDKYQFQWWACSLVNAQPYQGKKKGADGGIDGIIYFQDEPKAHKKIVVSVKGGTNVNVAMIRDLAHVVEREKAEIGVFVTLTPPSQPMLAEAIKEGYYTSPTIGGSFPKLQILTIEDLLNGTKKALYPDLSQGAITFKKTKAEQKTGKQAKLAGF